MDELDQPTVIQYLPPESLIEHSESSRIPEMNLEEWTDFLESVRVKNVVTDPVFALPDGRIFDGRHRLRAAKECSLRLIPVIFYNIDEAEALERMCNSAVLRRSLTPGQRAALVLEFAELVEELRRRAQENQRAAGKEYGRGHNEKLSPDLGKANKVYVAKLLAERAGVGKSSMEYLMAVQRDEPELFAKVKSGEYTINKAQTEMKKRKKASESGSQDNVVKFPRKKTRNREKLDEIVAVTPISSRNYSDGQPNDMSPDGILRFRAEKELPEYVTRLVADYSVLANADEPAVTDYLNKVKRVAEGILLILADYETDEEIRGVYGHIADILHSSRQENGNELIKQILGR